MCGMRGLPASHLDTFLLSQNICWAPRPHKGSWQLDSDRPGHLARACCQPGGGNLGRGWALGTFGRPVATLPPQGCDRPGSKR